MVDCCGAGRIDDIWGPKKLQPRRDVLSELILVVAMELRCILKRILSILSSSDVHSYRCVQPMVDVMENHHEPPLYNHH